MGERLKESEADPVLDRVLGVLRHHIAGDEIVPVLEAALGARFDDRLGAGFPDLRQLVQVGGGGCVEIDLLNLRRSRGCRCGGRRADAPEQWRERPGPRAPGAPERARWAAPSGRRPSRRGKRSAPRRREVCASSWKDPSFAVRISRPRLGRAARDAAAMRFADGRSIPWRARRRKGMMMARGRLFAEPGLNGSASVHGNGGEAAAQCRNPKYLLASSPNLPAP